jgi:hypothetical protein
MNELHKLIETAYRLSNTLAVIAEAELKDNWNLGYRLEDLSYDTFVIANSLKELTLTLSEPVLCTHLN